METIKPKQRRTETADERILRFDLANQKARDQALAEQDAIDVRIRRSIDEHGA